MAAKTPLYRSIDGTNALAMRIKRRMNQGEFWRRLGVTQSGGSRYETGRNIPQPVRRLLALADGNPSDQIAVLRTIGVDLEKLSKALQIAVAKEAEATAAADAAAAAAETQSESIVQRA